MKLQPFPWYGGKLRHINDILPELPDTDRFVSAFGGSGAILLNKQPAGGLEVHNDINGEIKNFFEVLRDRPGELERWLLHTPYHEGVFEEAEEKLSSDELSAVERAGYFFVACTMSYNAKSNSFAYSTKEIRRDRSQHNSRYQYKVERLGEVAERLHRVQFMDRDYREILERFDKDGTLLYADPPYPPQTRNANGVYEHEMSEDEHREFLQHAREYPQKMAISSYETAMYNEELLPNGWWLIRFEEQGVGATNSGATKQEVLYTNYEPLEGGEEVVREFRGGN